MEADYGRFFLANYSPLPQSVPLPVPLLRPAKIAPSQPSVSQTTQTVEPARSQPNVLQQPLQQKEAIPPAVQHAIQPILVQTGFPPMMQALPSQLAFQQSLPPLHFPAGHPLAAYQYAQNYAFPVAPGFFDMSHAVVPGTCAVPQYFSHNAAFSGRNPHTVSAPPLWTPEPPLPPDSAPLEPLPSTRFFTFPTPSDTVIHVDAPTQVVSPPVSPSIAHAIGTSDCPLPVPSLAESKNGVIAHSIASAPLADHPCGNSSGAPAEQSRNASSRGDYCANRYEFSINELKLETDKPDMLNSAAISSRVSPSIADAIVTSDFPLPVPPPAESKNGNPSGPLAEQPRNACSIDELKLETIDEFLLTIDRPDMANSSTISPTGDVQGIPLAPLTKSASNEKAPSEGQATTADTASFAISAGTAPSVQSGQHIPSQEVSEAPSPPTNTVTSPVSADAAVELRSVIFSDVAQESDEHQGHFRTESDEHQIRSSTENDEHENDASSQFHRSVSEMDALQKTDEDGNPSQRSSCQSDMNQKALAQPRLSDAPSSVPVRSKKGSATFSMDTPPTSEQLKSFMVRVPKPYPGVQYRRSRRLDDRLQLYAMNGSIVEGKVEDDAWLEVYRFGKSYALLPMRIGTDKIILEISRDGEPKRSEPIHRPWCLCAGAEIDDQEELVQAPDELSPKRANPFKKVGEAVEQLTDEDKSPSEEKADEASLRQGGSWCC